MLIKPFLAKCGNRSNLPKLPPVYGMPEEWFSNQNISRHQLFGISFDFFVNWAEKPPALTPIIWIKRIIEPAHSYQQVIDDLENVIINEFTIEYLNQLVAFSAKNKLIIQLVLFKDDQDWKDEKSQILLVEIKDDGTGAIVFNPELVSIKYFKEIIKANSGGPVSVGSKGLIYGTSELECFLSHTNSLYPGDLDLLLLDPNCNVEAILEFKKHNLNTPIEGQKLSNYYPTPDARKYNRIAILKDYLSNIKGIEIPIFNIYYPTKEDIKEARIELLKGSTGSLETHASRNVALPTSEDAGQYDQVIRDLKEGIGFHVRKNQ